MGIRTQSARRGGSGIAVLRTGDDARRVLWFDIRFGTPNSPGFSEGYWARCNGDREAILTWLGLSQVPPKA